MAETLQLIITADNKAALDAINDTIKGTKGLETQFRKVGSASNEANQVLINSGRVLQDLNYGFMGIANNLNPLQESFSRLGAKTKEGTSVFGELKDALMGPAGIGVALSLVSFVVLKFGDDIGKFFSSLSSGGKELMLLNDTFSQSKDAFVKAYTEMKTLGTTFDEFHKGNRTQKQVLDEFNKSLGTTAGTTKDINEAETIYINNKDKYVQAALYRAAGLIATQKAAEEAFKAQEALQNPKGAVKTDLLPFETIGPAILSKLTGAPLLTLGEAIGSEEVNKKAIKNESIFKNIADTFNQLASNIEKTIPHTNTYGQEVGDLTDKFAGLNKELSLELFLMKQFRDRTDKLAIPELTYGEKSTTQARERDFKLEKERVEKGANSLGQFLKKTAADTAPLIKAENDIFDNMSEGYKKASQSAKEFSEMMAGGITNGLQSAYDALQSGESVFDALTTSLMKFTEQLVFAIIQQQILASIQGTLSIAAGPMGGGLVGAAAGGGGFFDFIFSLLNPNQKHATGGIATSPRIGMIGEAGPEAIMPLSKLGNFLNTSFNAGAMSGGGMGSGGQFVLKGSDLVLALQRSNNSLNIRRGI